LATTEWFACLNPNLTTSHVQFKSISEFSSVGDVTPTYGAEALIILFQLSKALRAGSG